MNHTNIKDLEALATGLNAMPRGAQRQQLTLLQLILAELKSYLTTFPKVFGEDPSESLHLTCVHMDTGAQVPVVLQSGSEYKTKQPALHIYYGVGATNMRAFNKVDNNTAHGHIILVGSAERPRLVYWRTPHVRVNGHYTNFVVYDE